jgi:uncharacterized protein with PQ loop repeat
MKIMASLERERHAFQITAKVVEEKIMADGLNLIMLILASIGAMAFSILAAYGILRAGFSLMRQQPRSTPVKPQAEAARGL